MKANSESAMPSDEELARAFQTGDENAFDELVRRHQSRMYGIAYRMLGNREDALEVTQEALVKMYRQAHTWRPTGRFSGWLSRLTVNQSLDELRRRKRRPQTTDLESAAARVDLTRAGRENPARSLELDEIERRVQDALECLSPSQRAVFVLRHYEGRRLAEIAGILECGVGSVKVHLFRALGKLREELADMREHGDS